MTMDTDTENSPPILQRPYNLLENIQLVFKREQETPEKAGIHTVFLLGLAP